MVLAAIILGLGAGSVSVVHGAFAANQQDKGTTGFHGEHNTVGHYTGNQSTHGTEVGNASCGPHFC